MEATRKNLKLLWWLRNLAILAEALAIKLAHVHFHLPLPYRKLYFIIALIAFVNFLTWFRLIVSFPVSAIEFFIQLLADIFALAALLYFTGSAANPFATLFVLQVMIAATILTPIYSWALALVTIAIYTLLLAHTPSMGGMIGADFQTHIRGMWVNFIILVILVNWFVARMNITLRKKELLLTENERIASLASLAVSAAHQLGTPLGTIGLISEGLLNQDSEKSIIISQQVKRCKEIISEITKIYGAEKAESGHPELLSDFSRDIASAKGPVTDLTDYTKLTLTIFANAALKNAITNILDNAHEASPKFIEYNCFVKAGRLYFTIRDIGLGIKDNITLGTTTKQTGLGMGIYLSQSIIARLGGSLKIAAQKSGGTLAEITIPLERIKI